MVRPAAVSIVIPTQRRTASLAAAARSVLRQSGVSEPLELVIVDNDAAPSARAVALALAREAPFPVVYVHEPKSGVANARNAGVARAAGELIAFLDDDEEAADGWLAALLETQRRFDADVVFGPVRGRAPETVLRHRAYLEHFFSRLGPAEPGLIHQVYGCGDSLVRRGALPDPKQPFSALRNQTGGEDDLLFADMKAAGARFAWAPDAMVWEDPSPDRLNLGYALVRAFVYGQGPPRQCVSETPPDRLGAARWMLIGLGQALVFGLEAAIKALIRAPDRAFAFDRAARGLGKVFWWDAFTLHFYGHASPTQSQPAAAFRWSRRHHVAEA